MQDAESALASFDSHVPYLPDPPALAHAKMTALLFREADNRPAGTPCGEVDSEGARQDMTITNEKEPAASPRRGTEKPAATIDASHEALKRFRQIFKAVQQHSQRVEQRCGLTSAQLWAVAELARRPGQRVSDIACAMSIHPSTASNLLDKLERKGILKKERQRDDQRVVRLTVTDSGLNLLASAPDPPEGILQRALFTLPEPVVHSLVENLDHLVTTMEIDFGWAALEPLETPNASPSSDAREPAAPSNRDL